MLCPVWKNERMQRTALRKTISLRAAWAHIIGAYVRPTPPLYNHGQN